MFFLGRPGSLFQPVPGFLPVEMFVGTNKAWCRSNWVPIIFGNLWEWTKQIFRGRHPTNCVWALKENWTVTMEKIFTALKTSRLKNAHVTYTQTHAYFMAIFQIHQGQFVVTENSPKNPVLWSSIIHPYVPAGTVWLAVYGATESVTVRDIIIIIIIIIITVSKCRRVGTVWTCWRKRW